MKILFLHPDLGIGGAERLVVDVGLALSELDHPVHFVTTHHDPEHCFSETKDGTLPVTVVGDWMPRSILGRCFALCAYLRMIVAAFYIIFTKTAANYRNYDVIFCDQVSAPIAVIKLALWLRRVKQPRIIFYCHFPDQLLTKRENMLKKIYRFPIDSFEERTTGLADCILVNSNFTAHVFRQTFKSLSDVNVKVLYPTCNFAAFDRPLKGSLTDLNISGKFDSVFLSINRYERKKNLGLALGALATLKRKLEQMSLNRNVHLIVCGGCDDRVIENKEYFEELVKQAKDLGIEENVSFLKSPTDSEKHLLLHSCTSLLYTPENEHFGIVPLEAMYMRRPVIACNSGGPLETVNHEETGFLCNPDENDFAQAMLKFVTDRSLAREMGIAGHNHVKQHFSFNKFKNDLKNVLNKINAV